MIVRRQQPSALASFPPIARLRSSEPPFDLTADALDSQKGYQPRRSTRLRASSMPLWIFCSSSLGGRILNEIHMNRGTPRPMMRAMPTSRYVYIDTSPKRPHEARFCLLPLIVLTTPHTRQPIEAMAANTIGQTQPLTRQQFPAALHDVPPRCIPGGQRSTPAYYVDERY